jgi:hypothetical protein
MSTWGAYRRSITKLVLLTSEDLAEDTPHDLPAAGLGQVGHDEDGLGGGEGADALADLHDEVLAQLVVDLVAVLDGHEGVDGLARQLVVDAHHGRLGHGLVLDQRRFDLRRGEPVAADVDDVVDSSADPVVALVITPGAVAGELPWLVGLSGRGKGTHVVSGVDVQVRVHVPLVSAPDGAGHAGPRLLERQHALDIVAVDLLAGNRVDDRWLDAEEGEGGAARLSWGDAGQGSDDMGAGLRLPVRLQESAGNHHQISATYIYNVALLLADYIIVPLPDLGGDRLSDGAQDTQVLHLSLDVLVSGALEQSQSGGGDVELGHVMLLDDIPVPREVGVSWSALEHDGGYAEEERGVDNVSMAGDPADVAAAEEAVRVVDIEHVLAGDGGAHEVARGGVQDALGLAGGARGVQQEQGVLRVHGLRGDVRGPLLDLLVPPPVAALGHRHIGSGALEDQAVGDIGALLQRIVDDLLGADELATALALVTGDDDLGLGINDPVTQRVGREAREDDRVDGTNAGAGQERHEGLGDHGEVDGDGITLLDAHLLEDVGGAADLAEELAVGQGAALADLVGLVDDGGLVGVGDGVAVDAVVGGIELALEEPGIVAVSEAAGVDGLEVAGPGEEIPGLPGPELFGLGDGFFVESLVLLDACGEGVSGCGEWLNRGGEGGSRGGEMSREAIQRQRSD